MGRMVVGMMRWKRGLGWGPTPTPHRCWKKKSPWNRESRAAGSGGRRAEPQEMGPAGRRQCCEMFCADQARQESLCLLMGHGLQC
jgi:hypothetical protein